MALFAGLGAVEDVVLFKASGAQHHKVGARCTLWAGALHIREFVLQCVERHACGMWQQELRVIHCDFRHAAAAGLRAGDICGPPVGGGCHPGAGRRVHVAQLPRPHGEADAGLMV